jgi:hypothetical protein
MSPKIIVLKDEGYRLRIAKAPLGDPKVKYRKEVGIIAEEDEGEISFINQEVLRERQQQLGLSSEEAQQIEFEVLEPYRQRKAKLARYRQVFTQAVQQNYSLTEKNNNALKRLQLTLNLREEDVRSIEAEILEESNLTSAKAVQRVEPIEPVIRSVPVQEVRHESEEFSEDDLGSERNVDYRPLQAFLKAGDWQRADIETAAIMQGIEGAGENLTAEEVLNLPCQDLATIDQLWTKYSGGKFSFSVQRRIYLGSGGTLMARSANSLKSEVWTKFSTQVGWFTSKKLIAYSDATFDISAPDGHFPFGIYMWGLKLWGGSTIFIDLGEVFFFRITQCRV